MVTPFDQNLEVGYAKAKELAQYLSAHGSEGIVVCGTTGESPVLSDEEKIKMFSSVKEAVGEKCSVWANTGTYNTKHSIELSQAAEKTGADGIMLITPYYNRPDQEGLYQHFKKIAEKVSLPIMLYNVPGRTGVNLLPNTTARLAQIENIVSIKEACGNLDQISYLRTIVPESFTVYSGDDSLTLPMLSVGGWGIVSVVSHIVGDELSKMIYAYVKGNIAEAAELHLKLYPIFKGMFVTSNPVPVKEALNLMGLDVGGLRPPLVAASENDKTFIKNLLQNFGLIS